MFIRLPNSRPSGVVDNAVEFGGEITYEGAPVGAAPHHDSGSPLVGRSVELGLLDTVAGLALIYLTFNLALVIWMMQTFFDSVPPALEEAAWIDGCGIWEAFFRIALPLAAPGLAATAVLCLSPLAAESSGSGD